VAASSVEECRVGETCEGFSLLQSSVSKTASAPGHTLNQLEKQEAEWIWKSPPGQALNQLEKQAPVTTSTTLPNNASAHELMGVGEDSAADLTIFLSGLQFDVMMMIFFSFVLLFGVKQFPIISQNNVLIGVAPKHYDLSEGWFGWARASLALTGDEVQQTAGLDRRMLVEFTHMSMKILASTSGVMILYMAPLDYLYGKGRAMEVGDQLSYIDLGNVQFGHPWLYYVIALNCIWCSFVVRHFVHQAMKNFVELRFKWLEALPSPRASTVLVEGIPEDHQSDEKLHAFFDRALTPGCVKEARTVKHCQALEKLYATELSATSSLGDATSQWEQTGKAEDKRPKLSGGADAIEHWTQEVERIRAEVATERKRVLEESKQLGNVNADSGFVTFDTVANAELAKNITFSADKAEWLVSTPPETTTIIWNDLRANQNVKQVSGWIGVALASALYACFTPVCVATNNLASATDMGPLQAYWASLAPTLGLTLFVCFYPTVMRLLFQTFFDVKSSSWTQHKLQSWYFWFQVFFVVLVTAVGNNFIDFSSKVLANPQSIITIMADKMPKSTHFYMNYLAYSSVSHVMYGSRYMQLFKFNSFRAVFGAERAKQKAEPEDPDYYGMGSMHARTVSLLVIGLVYGTMSPLVGILGLVSFAVMRLYYGYVVVFAETQKVDCGGIFWVTALEHTQKGMLIYNVLMFGVLSARSPNWIPVAGAVIGLVYTVLGLVRFQEAFQWEKLPFTRVLEAKNGVEKAGGEKYVQPALVQ